ncbi:HAD family hydrolase, partial [Candidatus Bathyarchaeota archaeon]
MPLEVVSFDMEGTLITPRFSELIWEYDIPRLYAEQHGLTLEEARRRVFEEYMEIGDERPEWYDIEYWFRRL